MYCGRQLFNSGCNNGHRSSIGSGLAYGTTTTVTVKASNSTATSEPVEYKYTKVDPSSVQKIYFDNSSYNWSDVYAYIYLGASNENAAWPGVKMTLDSATGYYVLEVPEEFAEGSVMFTESKDATTNRYPADMQPGLEIGGKNMIFKANHSWTEYTDVQPTTQPTTAATTATQPTTTQPTTTQPSRKILVGDTDFSTVINVKDSTLLQKYLTHDGSVVATDDFLTAADVNGDTRVTVKDATAIQCYLASNYSNAGNCGTYVGGETPTQPTTSVQPTTAEPTTAPQTDYIYFKNNSNWSKVMAYYWAESDTTLTSWPGEEMQSIGNNVYRIEIPSSAEYIIFNNGNGNQSNDIKLEGTNKIYENGSWRDFS